MSDWSTTHYAPDSPNARRTTPTACGIDAANYRIGWMHAWNHADYPVNCPECLRHKPGAEDEIRPGDRFRRPDSVNSGLDKTREVTALEPAPGRGGWWMVEEMGGSHYLASGSLWTRLPCTPAIKQEFDDIDRAVDAFKKGLKSLALKPGDNVTDPKSPPDPSFIKFRLKWSNVDMDRAVAEFREGLKAITESGQLSTKCATGCTPAVPCMAVGVCPGIAEMRITESMRDVNGMYLIDKLANREPRETPELRCARNWGCDLVRTK